MNSVSTKTGADYQRFEDRLPTLRLTDAEILALQTTALRILDSGEIRWNHLEDALGEVFGLDAVPSLLDALRNRTAVDAWSRRDTVRLIAALYPYIPGETEGAKAAWVVDQVQPCFDQDRWDAEVFPFVLQRIEEYRAAGGTLDRWPDVVEPPPPPPEPSVDQSAQGFIWKPVGEHSGRPVVLLPAAWTGLTKRDMVLCEAEGTRIEDATYANTGNGDREHYRFAKRAHEYPAPSQLIVTAGGAVWMWIIPDPSNRYDNLLPKLIEDRP